MGLGQRIFGFVHEEGHLVLAEHGFHVGRGGVAAFCPNALLIVQDGVEYVQPQVSQSEFVEVREKQTHPEVNVILGLMDRIQLIPQVTGRAFHVG